ncbi:LigT-like protein [Schizopora paradoxa]|uniref:LigT-like protein n=1 Tax=Schizopora paradoxa TaxID=27342 RepID=A0A0H2RFW1_9AGAM|nr:LigT-like protein [Schizopora paradoxa]
MGLALWIVPPASVRDKLKAIMDNPPLEPEIEPPLPLFEPHITLASVPVSVTEAKLKDVIRDIQGTFRVDFESVEAQQTYFRSAIVHIRKTAELENLLASIKTAIPVDVKAPYYPHMSLFYIDDVRAADRQLVIDRLFQSGHLVPCSGSTGLAINFAPEDGSKPDALHGFDADAIWVVLCDGPVNDWRVLYKQNLHPKT